MEPAFAIGRWAVVPSGRSTVPSGALLDLSMVNVAAATSAVSHAWAAPVALTQAVLR